MDSSQTINVKYSVNQQIVYPMQGVGKIENISSRKFKGKDVMYYEIYLAGSDMRVMIPTEKADDIGIRALVSDDIAQSALDKLSKGAAPIITDWKLRYQNNIELLKSGDVSDIAEVVCSLYFRSKNKELPILERKLFDNALNLMIDELALSLGKTKDEVEEMIYASLERG